jgi:hypothetical protein
MLCEVHGRPQLHLSQAQDAEPKGVITIDTSFQRVYECEVDCCELAAVAIAFEELAAIRVATV